MSPDLLRSSWPTVSWLGLPVSGWLGFRTPMREVGLWSGFVVSLGAVAVFLMMRIRVMLTRDLRRVRLAGWDFQDQDASPST